MRIADILTPERIALDAEIGAKQEVLARLATMLAAADNAPVDLLFALCVPPGATAEHLALLSDLAHLFNEVPLATSLRLAASNSETYAPLTKGAPDA